MNQIFNSITDLSKFFVQQVIQPEDIVIDATAGNGNDTIFLAKQLSDKGMVFSFDVQKKAIDKTRERIISECLSQKVSLIHAGHQEIAKYVKKNIKVAMFNLGYLPGGDHSITTKGSTTILALEQTMSLLKPGGIISVCVYSGHLGGKEELEDVIAFTKSIDYKCYNVLKIDFYNKINDPPILIMIERN